MNDSISSFDQIVSNELHEPLVRLCAQLASEGAVAEHEFFNQIVLMLSPPRSEITVLEAIFQLSNCAFLNYEYSFEATEQIDKILERAISLSEVMSADSRQWLRWSMRALSSPSIQRLLIISQSKKSHIEVRGILVCDHSRNIFD